MKVLIFTGIGISALWLQLSLAPMIAVGGIKPNFMMIVLLVLGLRLVEPWLFIYAALSGLAHDAFSHGILGVYGISYFLVYFAARFAGMSIFDNSLGFIVLGVLSLSFMEGLFSVSLFQFLDGSVPWWGWMIGTVLPTAFYNALLAPLAWVALSRLERVLRPQVI